MLLAIALLIVNGGNPLRRTLSTIPADAPFKAGRVYLFAEQCLRGKEKKLKKWKKISTRRGGVPLGSVIGGQEWVNLRSNASTLR